MENQTNPYIYCIIISVVFIIILITPVTDTVFHFTKNITINEQRPYARAPELNDLNVSIANYLDVFEKYYNDNFNSRALLIKISSYFRYYVFKSSITSKVVIGKNNWIHNLGNEKCYVESKNFSSEKLLVWKNNLEKMNNFSLKNNITFVLVIIPSKETVYPEYFPKRIKLSSNLTNQLKEYLNSKMNITIIDLEEEFNIKKQSYKLFYTNDHHWTNTGAYFGYLKIIEKLREKNKNLEINNLSDFKKDIFTKRGYTARMIGMENTLLDSDILYSYNKTIFNRTAKQNKSSTIVITSSNNYSKPNIMVRGDSFLMNLINFISISGNNVTYIMNEYPSKRITFESIKKQNISIIIYETCENNLLNPDIISYSDIK